MNDAEKYLVQLRSLAPINPPIQTNAADVNRPWLEQFYEQYCRLYTAVRALEGVVYCYYPTLDPKFAPAKFDPQLKDPIILGKCSGPEKGGSPPPPTFPPP
jgi:hypothetical protein